MITALISAALVLIFYIVAYNGLVRLRQKSIEAWSGIDVQLRRRHDLIPLLVRTVEGYANQERAVLTDITTLRAEAIAVPVDELAQRSKVEGSIVSRLSNVFAFAEQYPQLKANENFLKLQEELVETEDQIASSRNIYNSNATQFNTRASLFPLSFIAAAHHFKKFQLFLS